MNAEKQAIPYFPIECGDMVYFRVSATMPAERAKVIDLSRNDEVTVEWVTDDNQVIGKETVAAHKVFKTHADAMAYHNKVNTKAAINDDLTYWQKQLILYTKGHYGPVQWAFDELKYFAAALFDLHIEYVTQRNVNAMIEVTIETLLEHGAVKQTIWRDMTKQLLRDDHMVKLTPENRYISYMLSRLQGIHVVEHNLELGDVSEDMTRIITQTTQKIEIR